MMKLNIKNFYVEDLEQTEKDFNEIKIKLQQIEVDLNEILINLQQLEKLLEAKT